MNLRALPRVRWVAVLLGAMILTPIANLLLVATGRGASSGLEIPVWSPAMDEVLFQDGGDYRFESRWLWEPRPGAVLFGDVINDQACRGPSIPFARNANARILVIGDSQSFGHAVRDAESWPRRLESLLSTPERKVEVVNASCPGHTIVLGLARFLAETSRFTPDIVVIAYSVGNEGARPSGGRSDVALLGALQGRGGRLERVSRRVSLLRTISSIFGELDTESLAPGSASFRVSPLEAKNTAGLFILSARQSFAAVPIVLAPIRQATFDSPADDHGAIDAAFVDAAGSHGAQVVDARVAFSVSGLDAASAFRDPFHFTPEGHEVVARAVAEALRASGALAPK